MAAVTSNGIPQIAGTASDVRISKFDCNSSKQNSNSTESNGDASDPNVSNSDHISVASVESTYSSSVYESDSDLGAVANCSNKSTNSEMPRNIGEHLIATGDVKAEPRPGITIIQDSSDILFGNKTICHGPVTINNIVQADRAANDIFSEANADKSGMKKKKIRMAMRKIDFLIGLIMMIIVVLIIVFTIRSITGTNPVSSVQGTNDTLFIPENCFI